MNKIYKILQTGSGDEFFVSAKRMPKLKNLITLISKNFSLSEEEIVEKVKNDDFLLCEIKVIKI